ADTARIGSALVAGYLLGRTKKAKKAITLALWLTGKNKMLQPQNLAKMALTKLQDSPVAGEIITQIRGPLATAASKAALATLESRATAFADSLHEKTLALQPPGAEDAEADEDEAASEDAEDTQDTEDTEEAEGTGDEQAADDTDQEQ